MLLLFVLSSCLCYDFVDFVIEFHKDYADHEYLFRMALFNANYSLIRQANQAGSGYTLAVNNWTDWTY